MQNSSNAMSNEINSIQYSDVHDFKYDNFSFKNKSDLTQHIDITNEGQNGLNHSNSSAHFDLNKPDRDTDMLNVF